MFFRVNSINTIQQNAWSTLSSYNILVYSTNIVSRLALMTADIHKIGFKIHQVEHTDMLYNDPVRAAICYTVVLLLLTIIYSVIWHFFCPKVISTNYSIFLLKFFNSAETLWRWKTLLHEKILNEKPRLAVTDIWGTDLIAVHNYV